MATRTSSKTVTFMRPFRLSGRPILVVPRLARNRADGTARSLSEY